MKNLQILAFLWSLLIPVTGWGQGNIFWGGIGKVIRSDANGQNITTIIESNVLASDKIALDLTNNKMYWTVTTDDFSKILCANLDGSNIQEITNSTTSDFSGIALAIISGKIYWSEVDYALDIAKIKRANLDGTNIETLVSLTQTAYIEGITLDLSANKMYWVKGNEIQRANLNGTSIETVLTSNSIYAFTMSNIIGKMYWFEYNNNVIRRANLDGSVQEDLLIGVGEVRSIALNTNTGKVYWTENTSGNNINEGRILLANLDGTSDETLLVGSPNYGIAVDNSGGKIYWASDDGIKRADLTGDNEEELVPAFEGAVVAPSGIALDISAGKMYLNNQIIQRANIDGSNLEDLITTGLGDTDGDYDEGGQIALDISAGKMYWVGDSTIERANLDGSNRQVLISFTGSSLSPSLALDTSQNKMYWVIYNNSSNTFKIQRASLEGNGVQTILEVTNISEQSIALDIIAQKIYWAETGIIKRANSNGSQIQTVCIGGNYVDYIAVDVANNKLYWVAYDDSFGTQIIRRANLDGTGIEILVTDNYSDYTTSFAISNCPPIQVSLQANKPNTICAGEPITFTASVGGINPQYQWYINNTLVATTNTPTFSTNLIQNNDVVKVILTRTDACPGTATSNTLTFTVNPVINSGVSITVENGAVCTGISTKFIAKPINGGTNPQYQWVLNGNNVGSNSAIYETSNLTNGDILFVVMSSNSTLSCLIPIAQSEIYVVNLLPNVSSSVNISANISSGQTVCNDDFITFYAQGNNTGNSPKYIWIINGIVSDTTNVPNYTTNTFNDNGVNVVSVRLLSSYPCLSNGNPVSSANFSFNTIANITPALSLQALSGAQICVGEIASFKANPIGGGIEPLYQWYINSVPQGILTQDDIFTTIVLQNGDKVKVVMVSNLSCASPQSVSSNEITMQVNPAPIVEVSTNVGNTICQGETISFTANPQNAGNNPTYQWRKNGVAISGAINNIYTINSINSLDNDANIDVVMTTTVNCNEPIAVSNPINIQVVGSIVPTVNIRSLQGFPICEGSDAIFGIDQINLNDPTATYVWKVNGNPVANSNVTVFNAGVLQNGATVQLQYTTILSCANPKTVNSNTLTVNTQALNAPNNLSVKALGANQINLTWQDNASNETRFRIERSVNNANNFQFLNTVGSNVEFFSDQNAQPNTLYFYRIRALNDNIQGCASDYCEAVGAATDDGEIVTALPKDRENGFKVFPNPSQTGIFQLHWLTDIAGKVQIEIFNLMNAKVFDIDFTKSSLDKTTSIDLSNQSAGMYYLKVSYQDRQYFVRVVRE